MGSKMSHFWGPDRDPNTPYFSPKTGSKGVQNRVRKSDQKGGPKWVQNGVLMRKSERKSRFLRKNDQKWVTNVKNGQNGHFWTFWGGQNPRPANRCVYRAPLVTGLCHLRPPGTGFGPILGSKNDPFFDPKMALFGHI